MDHKFIWISAESADEQGAVDIAVDATMMMLTNDPSFLGFPASTVFVAGMFGNLVALAGLASVYGNKLVLVDHGEWAVVRLMKVLYQKLDYGSVIV